MIYLALAGILASGVFAVFQFVQSRKVNVITNVNLMGEIDNAETFIRTKLTNSETAEISSISAGDNACLALTRTESSEFSGLYLSNGTTYIHDADFSAVSGSDDRTISIWFRASSKQVGRHWMFGSGRHNRVGQQFAVFLDEGTVNLDFKNSGYNVLDSGNQEFDLRDDEWYHLAVVVDAPGSNADIEDVDFTVYLNKASATSFDENSTNLDGYWLSNHDERLNTVTGHEGFVAGARTKTGVEPFTGALFDLRIWDTALTTAQVKEIFDMRQKNPQTQNENLVLNWRFTRDVDDTDAQIDDGSGSNNHGTIKRRDGGTPDFANLPFSTTVETTKANLLALYDLDSDNQFELWHADDKTIKADTDNCPSDPTTDGEWIKVSGDIFTKDSDGFFQSVSDEPQQTLFRYGYSDDELNVAAGRAVGTAKLALTRDIRSDALCRHGHEVIFDTTGCTSDNFERAYAWIVENFDNSTEKLVVLGATETSDGARTIYSNMPFAPASMQASWDPRTGVMTFTNSDNSSEAASIWADAMKNVAYEPTGTNYFSKKTLKFSVGHLSYEVGDNDHFYNFNDSQMTHTNADNAATSSSNQLCGMQGYLATITSPLEQEFLATRFLQSDDSWPAGWLGGTTDGSNWTWQSPSPESNRRFWIGDGHDGKAVQDDSSASGSSPSGNGVQTGLSWISKRVDLDNTTSGDLIYRQATASAFVDIRYTRFAGGTDTDLTKRCLYNDGLCEPHNGSYLQMTTGPKGHGLWSAVANNRSCDSGLDKVCGYFQEWTDNVSARLVDEVMLDLQKYRAVCQL